MRSPQLLSCRRLSSSSWKRPSFGPNLLEYTGGRFLFNEELRRSERRLNFNVNELANVLCHSVGRPVGDLVSITKLVEGGFNRVLQATLNDDRKVLARIPFRITAPAHYATASEAATLTLLRQHSIPVPKVLGYSCTSANPVGTEYLLLEKLEGKPLSDTWFSLEPEVLTSITKQIVDIEVRYMSIPFPASGSLYFDNDLTTEKMVPVQDSERGKIIVGPLATYAWWYQQRAALHVDKGPWNNFSQCFEAPARRELGSLKQHGKPRLHYERSVSELHGFKERLPATHAKFLSDYLKLAPSLDVPERFTRPTLRHPDFSPSNILINDNNEITGIIDWQHAAILPLALCAGVPRCVQNWGNSESTAQITPPTALPANLESLTPAEQHNLEERLRKKNLHCYYTDSMRRHLPDHFDAIHDESLMLRAKLYDRAAAPWEGDSLSLKHTIIDVMSKCPLHVSTDDGATSTPALATECPVTYSHDEIVQCMEEFKQQEEKYDDVADMRAMMGTNAIGWVENDEHLEMAKEMKEAIRNASLELCETEDERRSLVDHFPFDDHEED
ncbi:phosphotransferase enzyme family protein [Massariosphaeria phaeospora]|uniref:Phosphotransferase enzyme family protein n=1 Tax=Massariosphaeria phaeospora TaxID=100035 RepID=A0A7C8I9E2_9PLEO|nr:phosphotransferase enzyme family protein [Massariosphaeria phaeospora]